MVVIRESGCNWAKVVVFGQSGCVRKRLLYSCKVVVFGKVVLIGQKWLLSGKNGCIRTKVVIIGKVVVLGQKCLYSGTNGCIRAKVVVYGLEWL